MPFFTTRIETNPGEPEVEPARTYYGLVIADTADEAMRLTAEHFQHTERLSGACGVSTNMNPVDAAHPYAPHLTIKDANVDITGINAYPEITIQLPFNTDLITGPTYFVTITAVELKEPAPYLSDHWLQIAVVYAADRKDAKRIIKDNLKSWATGDIISFSVEPIDPDKTYTELLRITDTSEDY